jgi:hypothetical protein
MDEQLEAALIESASRFERTLAQEARFRLRRDLGLYSTPAGDLVGSDDAA